MLPHCLIVLDFARFHAPNELFRGLGLGSWALPPQNYGQRTIVTLFGFVFTLMGMPLSAFWLFCA